MQADTDHDKSQRYIPILIVALSVLALAMALLAFFSGRYDYTRNKLFTDGDVYALLFFYDDVTNGVDISGWRVPPALKLLPDQMLYFLVRSISPEIFTALPLYGVVQFLLFAAGLIVLARQILPRLVRHLRFGVMSLMLVLFLLTYRNIHFASRAFVPIYHFGVLAMIPWVLALIYKLLFADRPQPAWLVALFLLNLLMGASDSFYFIQFAVPVCIVLLLMPLLAKLNWKRVLMIIAVIAIGCAFGFGGYRFLSRNNPTLHLYGGKQSLAESLQQTGDLLRILLDRKPWHAAALGLFIAGCLSIGIQGVAKRSTTPDEDHGRRLLYALYYLVATGTNVAGVIVMRLDAQAFRYFLPVLLLPAWLTVPYILRLPKRFPAQWGHWLVMVSLLVSCVFSFIDIDLGYVRSSFSEEVYPDFVQCVDEHTATFGVNQGIAHFWQARPLTALTQQDLQVVQVQTDFNPFYWNNNLAWYAMEPEFIIFDHQFEVGHELRLDETLALARFGEADATFTCEESVIWVYTREDSALRRLFDGVWQD